ncbi:MAG TPA: hypothetical protein ENJ65_02010 [Candidatus Tenderia electrophaga]|uniref:Phosphoglycerate mutase n=1 Tax=Candidatus Tenderia electrophaga TaxID=1748243 RepID=A0A832J7T9_9GAMM|nr:hypothetical protein [Candidatus Tenderia electrophaga]
MLDRHITLYIPGLFGSPAWSGPEILQGLSLSGLELLLSRGRRRHQISRSSDEQLFELFAHSRMEGGLPVAAVMSRFDLDEPVADFYLCATPVNMQPDRDRLLMLGADHLAVTVAEARQLADEFNQLFAEDGLWLDVPVSSRWYLRINSDIEIATQPLKAVVGQDVGLHLPTGKDAMRWHAMLNEVQMLFYSSSVNEKRRMSGQPEINSIWLWGEGELPPPQPNQWQCVWSNEPLSCALASLGKNKQASMPATADEWLEQADQGGRHLLVFDVLAEAVAQHDIGRWRDMMESINDDWIEVLTVALKNNSIASIQVLSENAEFNISRKSLKHWWKRTRPLMQLK